MPAIAAIDYQMHLSTYGTMPRVCVAVPALIKSLHGSAAISSKIAPTMVLNTFTTQSTAMFTSQPPALTLKNVNMQAPTPRRIIINTTDIKIIHDCSSSTASRKLNQVRDALGKLPHHSLTIREYCQYYALDFTEVITALKLI